MGAPRFPTRRRIALLACAALFLACDRRVEPWREASAEPPRPTRPVRIPGLEQPVAQPMPALASAEAGGPGIRGTVRLGEGAVAPRGAVLFVIARGEAGGPPLAVKRLPAGPFPLAFEIGPGDAMVAGRPFAGPITLTARIDADGDPLTRGSEDLDARASSALQPGASGVELVLAPSGSS